MTKQKVKPRKPYLIDNLWGIWIPDAGPDCRGDWMQHANGPEDGPEAYESYKAAETAAVYYRNSGDFEGCYAAKLCGKEKTR